MQSAESLHTGCRTSKQVCQASRPAVELNVPLSADQFAYADKLFKLRILSSDGQAYENLFVEVMTLRDPKFRPVKPQGKIGDQKNDGYCSPTGAYHQVYAPENADDSPSKTITKIANDFTGLTTHWNTVCRCASITSF
jgi:hypothetical protein